VVAVAVLVVLVTSSNTEAAVEVPAAIVVQAELGLLGVVITTWVRLAQVEEEEAVGLQAEAVV
jgi:hypothetical protein